MRKIEAKMVAAVLTGGRMGDGNTFVETFTRADGVCVTMVYLFDNLIAKKDVAGWQFSLRGWNTPTARSRVNALLQGLEVPGRVYSVKGQAHFNGKPINHHDWVHVN